MTKDSMIAVLKSQIDAANTSLAIANKGDDRYAVGLHSGMVTALEITLNMARNLEDSRDGKPYSGV